MTRHFYALYSYCGMKTIYVFTNYEERYKFVVHKKFTSQITADSAKRLMKQGIQLCKNNGEAHGNRKRDL